MTLPDYLTQHADGEITLTGHRIGLFHIAHYYQEGFSPEMLACQYSTLPLALIHKVIAYYLENREKVDAYIASCRAELDRQQLANQGQIDLNALRLRLAARQHSESA
jgi:uncharacterized protein (DUF433 family)